MEESGVFVFMALATLILRHRAGVVIHRQEDRAKGCLRPARPCGILRRLFNKCRGSSGVEHALGKGGAGGSIPLRGTTFLK